MHGLDLHTLRQTCNNDCQFMDMMNGTCRQIHEKHIFPDCRRTISSKKTDNDVWAMVCKAINKPEILLAQASKMVAE